LSAGRVRFNHQNIQALGRSVYCRRQTSGTGAHDNHVAHVSLINAFVEAKAINDLLVARISQDGGAATDQHGQIVNRNMEPIQKILNLNISVEIDIRIRLVVASKKFFNAEGVERMVRTNQNQISNPSSDQFESSHDESPEKDVAEFAVG